MLFSAEDLDWQQKLSEQLFKEFKLLAMQISLLHRPTSTIEELVSSSTHPVGSAISFFKGLSLQLSFSAVKFKECH